jgi:beta-glucosidase
MGAAAVLPALPRAVSAAHARKASKEDLSFPKDFVWGAATSAYQVEGNNINSDMWVMEHVKPSIYQEYSGDACDHYHRYREDIQLVKSLGLNGYRFSIEWARVQPEEDLFSLAELEHYRRVLAACHENGVKPLVNFNHFTNPRWFAARGGWEDAGSTDRFARYCERTARYLGDLIPLACTFNEPSLRKMISFDHHSHHHGPAQEDVTAQTLAAARQATGAPRFVTERFCDVQRMQENMLVAHAKGMEAMKSGPGKYPVGLTLAIRDDQPVGTDAGVKKKRAYVYEAWLDAASRSDFIGVQNYGRSQIGANGELPVPPGVPVTQMGDEVWPQGLEQAVRYAAGQAKVPVYVTEHGIGTGDDAQRVDFIRRALVGLHKCIADGVDVRGYFHWSLMDNFEWEHGYAMTFGLIAVDRSTQQRTPKESARALGQICRDNGLVAA